jgi:signal peptidase I
VHFDLEMVLVLGSLLTGLVWLLDKFILRGRRESADRHSAATTGHAQTAQVQQNAAYEPWYVEYSKSFFPVLVIVLILRSFIAEPFRIPSGSMMPTLLVGDFILVNKFAYGVRLPVLHNEILKWGDLFNSRQKLALITFSEKIRSVYNKMQGENKDYAKAVVSYLGIIFSRHISYNTLLCWWESH